MIKIVLKLFSNIFYRISGKIITFKIYEKDISISYNIDDKVALIIQGNMLEDKFFLRQTILNYRKLYPKILIVISTWADSDKETIKEINKIPNVKVLLNDYPQFYGIKNINLQIVSTVNALKYLKDNKFKYALKTRTDQRICQYDSNYIQIFVRIIINKSKNVSAIKSKLLFSTMNSFRDRYYPISDMFMFGNIEDMLVYWDCDLDIKSIQDIKIENDNQYFMRQGTAEGYLLLKFMDRIKYIPKWNKECSDSFIKTYFHPIDYEYLEQFWYKYHWHIEYSTRYKNIIRGVEFIDS